ncbi:MAG: aldose 1-epimerase family protein [Clostridia bacterium]|jgi:hypothetical protein
MLNIFNQEFSKDELRKRIGHISQIAGTKRYVLKEGQGEGVEAIDVKTGSGLYFTILPDRAMDIAWMEYQGKPVAFISKSGIVHGQYYTPLGTEWLRNFFGGMLTTCGLTHVGPPETSDEGELGLHGRIANIPAEEVSSTTQWRDDELVMEVRGKIREAVIFGENLTLTRKIRTSLGENRFFIHDMVVNEGYHDAPFMILYHMNVGFSVVSEHSRLLAPILHTEPRDEEAIKGIKEYAIFQKPTCGYKEQVFFHQLAADQEGNTYVGIVNERMQFGVYIGFNKKQLPCFTQWKMMGQQDYVVGLEPGNCVPEGRSSAHSKGRLAFLRPGETHRIDLQVGILDGRDEITRFRKQLDNMIR